MNLCYEKKFDDISGTGLVSDLFLLHRKKKCVYWLLLKSIYEFIRNKTYITIDQRSFLNNNKI